MQDTLPQLDANHFLEVDQQRLLSTERPSHPPRILLLYGSIRERSYSRLLTFEAERILRKLGAETRIFHPRNLPLPDSVLDTHPEVQALRSAVEWSEGQVWCSPERHGAMTGVFKSQIDWIPLNSGAVRPTQGKTLALMQVCGGSQSFNTAASVKVVVVSPILRCQFFVSLRVEIDRADRRPITRLA